MIDKTKEAKEKKKQNVHETFYEGYIDGSYMDLDGGPMQVP